MALKFSEIIEDIEYDIQERMEELDALKDELRDLAAVMETGPEDEDECVDGSIVAVESDIENVMSIIEELSYTGPSVQRAWNVTLATALEYYREEYS